MEVPESGAGGHAKALLDQSCCARMSASAYSIVEVRMQAVAGLAGFSPRFGPHCREGSGVFAGVQQLAGPKQNAGKDLADKTVATAALPCRIRTALIVWPFSNPYTGFPEGVIVQSDNFGRVRQTEMEIADDIIGPSCGAGHCSLSGLRSGRWSATPGRQNQ